MADLERRRTLSTDPAEQAMLDAQIALERKAQEAELKAFDLQKDQIGVMQDLITALTTLNDNLVLGEMDMPPELQALYDLLMELSGMAGGGTMQAMHPYLVGEKGPELIIPSASSTILNALDTRRALGPPAMTGGNSTVNYGGGTTIYIDARDFGADANAIGRAVEAAVNRSSSNSDARIRTGVG